MLFMFLAITSMRLYHLVGVLFAVICDGLRHFRTLKDPLRTKRPSDIQSFFEAEASATAKLLNNGDNAVQTTSKLARKSKVSTGLADNVEKVSEIQKATTGNILDAGSKYAPGLGSSSLLAGSANLAVAGVSQAGGNDVGGSASFPPRYAGMISDPAAKLLEDDDDSVQTAGQFTKKNKFSTALIKDLAKVSAIEKATTGDILKAGLKYAPGSGYSLSPLAGSSSLAVAAIAQAAGKAIVDADHMKGIAPLNAPRFKPIPVTLSGPELSDLLVTALGDSAWSDCTSNPSSPKCAAVRARMEGYMDQMLSVNAQALPTVFGNMAQFYNQLTISKQQLIAIWLTLQGDKSVKKRERQGLEQTIPLLLKSIDQQTRQLEGAFDVVNKDIQSRYDILGPEMERLTKEQETASQSISDFGTRMTGTNQLKMAVLIRKFQNSLGESLAGVTNDAKDILEDTDNGLSEIHDSFDLYSGEYDPKLDMLKKGVQTLRSTANSQVKGIKESFKAAESALLYAAKSQDKDFRKDADRAMFDIPRAFNLTLNKGMKELDQNATRRFAPIATELRDKLETINRTLTKLFPLIEAHSLGATKDVNDMRDYLLSLMTDVVKDVDIKSVFYSKEIRDTAKLQADEMARTRQLGSYSVGRSDRVRQSANQKAQSARTRSSRLYSQLVDTVASGMTNMTLDVDAVVAKATLSAAGVADGTTSQLAEIKSKFFKSAVSTVDSMNDASESLATQKQLTSSRIKQLADISRVSTNQQEANLNAAIADAGITSDSLLSAANQNARDLSASSLLSITKTQNGFGLKSDALVSSLDSIFGNFQSDVLGASRDAKASVTDAYESVDSVGDMQRLVGNRVGDLSDEFSDYRKSNEEEFDAIMHALSSSESAINTTGVQAGTQLNASISSGLNSFLSSIQSTLDSTTSKNIDVVNDLMTTINENYADATTHTARITMENLKLQNELSDVISELTNSTPAANLEPLLRAIFNNETIHHMVGVRNPFDFFLNVSKNNEEAELVNIQTAGKTAGDGVQKLSSDANRDLDLFNGTLITALSDLKRVVDRLARDKDTIQVALSPSGEKAQLESRFNDLTARMVNISTSVRSAASDSFAKIFSDLSDTRSDVLRRSNETRQNVSERFDRVESLIAENLAMLNGGMSSMTSGFGGATKSQDKILRLQDEKFMTVAKDIAAALFTNQMNGDDDTVRDKATKSLGIVVGLIQALKNHDKGNELYYAELKGKIRDMKAQVDTTLGITADGMNQTIDSLGAARLREEIARSQFVDNLVAQFGPLLNSNAMNIGQSRNRLLALSKASSVAAAQAEADTYTMEGRWKSMSDQARARLSELIDSVRKGNLSVGEALGLAREAGITQMKSAQQAVEVMNHGMLKYLDGLHAAFDGSQDRLAATQRVVNQSLNETASKLITELDGLRTRNTLVSDSVKTFAGQGNLDKYMDEVHQLQEQVQGNQTAVNGMLEQIQHAVDQYESEMSKRETDYETYIQVTIDNVTSNVANREQLLRKRIFDEPNVPTVP